MAKTKGSRFSAETRAKIAAKATEAAESLRPTEGSVSLEVTDAATGAKRSATLHADGRGKASDVVDVIRPTFEALDNRLGRATVIPATTFSPQAKKSLALLHTQREAAVAAASEAKETAKGYREKLVEQIEEREQILGRCVTGPGVAEFSPGNSAAIVSISKTIEDLRRRIAGLRETYKLNKLRASEALSHIDQIVAGESPEGTIFASDADRKAGGR